MELVSEQDKEFLVAYLILIAGLYVCIASFTMPSRGGLAESPGIFPGIMGVTLLILGFAYALRAKRHGGNFKLNQLGRLFISMFAAGQNKQICLAILFVSVYVFLGVPFLGYYYSSALFMAVMFLIYVKRTRPWVSVITSISLALFLYLVFNKLFMLPIK